MDLTLYNSYEGKLEKKSYFLIPIFMSIFIAMFSYIAIFLPFSPIPITFQNTICIFGGIFLGKRMGTLAVIYFLMQGIIGFPFFAGGASSLFHILGPSGGYLIGYVLAAYFAGLFYENKKGILSLFSAYCLGSCIIYFCGFLQLSIFIGMKKAFLLGVLPFILPNLFKVYLIITGKKWSQNLLSRWKKIKISRCFNFSNNH